MMGVQKRVQPCSGVGIDCKVKDVNSKVLGWSGALLLYMIVSVGALARRIMPFSSCLCP